MQGLFRSSWMLLCLTVIITTISSAQITKLNDYTNTSSAIIGTYQGISFREGGFSGLYPVPNTNGQEFWVCSDRGVNIDAANANPSACRPTYDKIYAFPSYAPKIHRVRILNGKVQILQTITIKRPNGLPASGIINPTGFGSTSLEVASTDTVMDCANFNGKVAAKDTFGIDSEGLIVDKDGNFWLCEEGGPTIWKLNRNGVLIARYTPYANLPGAYQFDIQIDTVFKYRKNNRGFEGIAIAPNGKIYAIIQSPILYPNKTIGEGTRLHRILEIDPTTNAQRMFVYVNDGIIGASGSNQIRLRDWKIGDMAAINDTTFLVLEAAIRGTSDVRRLYRISLNGATTVHSGLYNGVTLESLIDSTGLTLNGIVPVKKTLVMDLLANGWPVALDKAEGLAILNDSTIAIGNDNDYGQFSPLENGIAAATANESHVIVYRFSGTNKLQNYKQFIYNLSEGKSAPSTEKTSYLTPVIPNVEFTSVLTVNDSIGTYKMSGIPDGIGAYDNYDGTFTVLMNHEISNGLGSIRAHGNNGAFVSKWIINKTDLSVVSGQDLIQNVKLWNGTGYTTYNALNPMPVGFNRFCSADLPASSALYNTATGNGTTERIFMNGEEAGDNGRLFAHIVTGPNTGTSYELPHLGKFSAENVVACPVSSDKTIVAGMDDSSPGQVYFYIGTKTNFGTEIDKAGLTNGKLYGVAVSGVTTESSTAAPPANTPFTLIDLGSVRDSTGTTINSRSNTLGVTNFLRPEDGAWDPSNPRDFYFVTTNSFTAPSRLWRLRFNNISSPEQGGTITAVLNGTEGQKMLDNMTIDNNGRILLQEDVGNNAHNGKIWQYTIATGQLKLLAQHDSTRFILGGANYLTQDEESSGIIDVQNILGPGRFLLVDQAHYPISGAAVEGGQLLVMFNPDSYNATFNTAPSSSNTPYLQSTISGGRFTSFLTVGDSVKTYRMCGLPDGLGAYDNNNGTFTLLMNHEISNGSGTIRAHGSNGAFVSKWVINKSDLSVVSGQDLIQSVKLWNGTGYTTYNKTSPMSVGFTRFCSADLPAPSAFYNSTSGNGTTERIFMNGEESGTEGRAFAHIATGVNSGTTYELPYLGKFSWENAVASPYMSNKTVVAGLDDVAGGQVYFYIGTKSNSGNEVDKAGLTNGKLYGVSVTGLLSEVSMSYPSANTTFRLADIGMVQNMTGASLQAASVNAQVTSFLRPEDGAWDPSNPSDFYFVTTNGFGLPSRMWRLRFTNPEIPEQGGTITAVLDGTEGQQMLDNLTIDNYGHILLQEDPGNTGYVAKVWEYTIATDKLRLVATHDSTRFVQGGASYLTQDEESSGIIDMQKILGPGMFLIADQAHYSIPGELVEGGQLLAFFNLATLESSEEIAVRGNNFNITNGDVTPDLSDNTEFGVVKIGGILRKQFVIANTGPVNLTVNNIVFAGTNNSEFEVAGTQYPFTVAANSTRTINVDFRPLTAGTKTVSVVISNSDFDESVFSFSLKASAVTSKLIVKGNSRLIPNGSSAISDDYNTDFGSIKINSSISKTFEVRNEGQSTLSVSTINIAGASNFKATNGLPFVLQPGLSTTLTVQFSPTKEGASMAIISLHSDDPLSPSYSFAVKGNAFQPKPDMELLGNAIKIAENDSTPSVTDNTEFGDLFIGLKKEHQFTILNSGTDNLDISSVSLSGDNESDFSVMGLSVFPLTLQAGTSTHFTIRFTPKAQGVRKSVLNIVSNVHNKNYSVTLKGNGQISTDVADVSNSLQYSVYPNPVFNNAVLKLMLSTESDIMASIYDVLGNEVQTLESVHLLQGEQTLPLQCNGLSSGMYVVRITINNKTYATQLVFQR
ncbi:MAG: choice-of-anchor D domain-containing protein [Candidatus Kapaibacterium sp.]